MTDPIGTLKDASSRLLGATGVADAIAELERRASIEKRRDEAMQGKWEFHFVWYPETSPYVEVWRKGSRFGSFAGVTPLAALEAALNRVVPV